MVITNNINSLDSIVSQIKDPSDVHKVVSELEYLRNEGNPIRSAKKVLESGKANCIDAAFAAGLLMEHLNFPFRALGLLLEGEFSIVHGVYVYQTEEGYFSIGKSRHIDLGSRTTPFPTIKYLTQSYTDCFAKIGFRLIMPFGLNNDDFQFDWKYSDEHLQEHLEKVIKRKYKEYRAPLRRK